MTLQTRPADYLTDMIGRIQKGELDDDLKDIIEVSEKIQNVAKERKEIVDYREYRVGDEFERKDYVYEIIAKTKEEESNEYLYTVKIRKMGTEDCDYQVFRHYQFRSLKKYT